MTFSRQTARVEVIQAVLKHRRKPPLNSVRKWKRSGPLSDFKAPRENAFQKIPMARKKEKRVPPPPPRPPPPPGV
ncbi:MAG: hypothetical protein ACHQ03_07740 [Candidatus Bathyarchaeia archaeon]